jgi:hypothetical protein
MEEIAIVAICLGVVFALCITNSDVNNANSKKFALVVLLLPPVL